MRSAVVPGLLLLALATPLRGQEAIPVGTGNRLQFDSIQKPAPEDCPRVRARDVLSAALLLSVKAPPPSPGPVAPGLFSGPWPGANLAIPTQQESPSQDEPSVGASIGYGLGLGLAGFLAGGLVGYGMASGCTSGELCELGGALVGAATGGTFGMALGVHLGNRRRGSFALDFLTGAAIWGAGFLTAAAAEDDIVTGAFFLGVPVLQLWAMVTVERATGRSRNVALLRGA